MSRKLFACIAIWTLVVSSFGMGNSYAADGDEWLIAAEHFPPYSYLENDYIAGIAVDYAQELLELADIPFDTQLLPWARVVEYLNTRPNTLTPAMAKTEDRLDKYLWLGPFDSIKIHGWTRKGADLPGGKPFRQLVSVIRGSAAETHLLNEQYVQQQDLLKVNTLEQMVGLLVKSRVDVIYVADNMDNEVLKLASNSSGAEIEKRELLTELPLYIAVSKTSSMMQMASLQTAANQILTAKKD